MEEHASADSDLDRASDRDGEHGAEVGALLVGIGADETAFAEFVLRLRELDDDAPTQGLQNER